MHVAFDASLARARAALADKGWLDPAAVQDMQPRLEAAAPGWTGSTSGRVDSEMVTLARNALQFQALAQGLSRHLGLLALAAADGRR
jgi:flagellar basal-body rod protein FlgB